MWGGLFGRLFASHGSEIAAAVPWLCSLGASVVSA
jgi:hypothetical protein